MIGTVVSFLVLVIVAVIAWMILTWGLEKMGIAIDPKLRTIIGLIVLVILLVIFLNWTGLLHMGVGIRGN